MTLAALELRASPSHHHAGVEARPESLHPVRLPRHPSDQQVPATLRDGLHDPSRHLRGLEHLAQPTSDAAEEADREMASSGPEDARSEIWEFVRMLRMLVQPYLGEGRTDVAFAAEMAGPFRWGCRCSVG